MFTKDECLLALKGLRALERAENFEKWNGQVAPQIKCDVMERLIEVHFEPQPYKFEDLKKGMWVWDKSYQEVCYIHSIVSKEKIYCEYLESHCSIGQYEIEFFEANRFYPVQMANEVKENE